MAYVDCREVCGNSYSTCKNKYCSNHPKYSAPVVKEKPKGGAGKPSDKPRAHIRKDNGTGYSNMFKD